MFYIFSGQTYTCCDLSKYNAYTRLPYVCKGYNVYFLNLDLISACKMHLSLPFQGDDSVVVDLLFYVPPIVCVGAVLVFVLLSITLRPF